MSAISRMWYEGRWYQWLLAPLSLLFWGLSALRRGLFRVGIKKQIRLPVPVIVVGNISVGGNGKTPLVVALCDRLTAQGFTVGVVSRGYGAATKAFPHTVDVNAQANLVGDEPLLIARRTGVPVVIDPNRPRGAAVLVEAFNCDVIISDDGLQHYALARDIECVVVDRRLFGNGFLLPMGPLREGTWRLRTVDYLIVNQSQQGVKLPAHLTACKPVPMQLRPAQLVNVKNPQQHRDIREMKAESTITALAGIGDPARFFTQLQDMGLALDHKVALSDHHPISAADIPVDHCVIMTEKDAVKAREFAHDNCWYQPVDAVLPEAFYMQLIQQIKRDAQ
ncbi:tetraacyldisaccharide 4'-kinase [Alteromonas gilva]|uniref:Tetraacyldisaccharide 4'-kinase n=1 Tax=Alteromonas gilva TaxID=2987522 RepID=A0ABT5L585_9ALTE|nr:tetraacyldisaccharide 4'-kinase [Alteromonas gilva]MDC8830933.1 tetraacyldisaccharide 4'-kinase [Alteromonas gilva]